MAAIHVVGVGLMGQAGMSTNAVTLIQTAQVLMGSDRHLHHFPNHPNPKALGNLSQAIAQLQQFLNTAAPHQHITLLTSGDPLFFGLGRLLVEQLPKDSLHFHPHLSSVQLAFSAIKQPWHDAKVVSVHGRSLDALATQLKHTPAKLAILTDPIHSPAAIAQLIISLELPIRYRCYVCENLGGDSDSPYPETITAGWAEDFLGKEFAPLNVMLLLQQFSTENLDLATLPCFGISDGLFATFRDRPGLMTKREVRILALAELALQPNQVIWDIGAGTGSVSIEMARLQPDARVYAVEKTAAGQGLIRQNCDRFGVSNIEVVGDQAPDGLEHLPEPDRVFIGGSGGNLVAILEGCAAQLKPRGRIILAIATLENLAIAQAWFKQRGWPTKLMQAQFSRGVAIANHTRWTPLNPVQIVTAQPHQLL